MPHTNRPNQRCVNTLKSSITASAVMQRMAISLHWSMSRLYNQCDSVSEKVLTHQVEVEGGRVPSANWILNLQILTSGGFR